MSTNLATSSYTVTSRTVLPKVSKVSKLAGLAASFAIGLPDPGPFSKKVVAFLKLLAHLKTLLLFKQLSPYQAFISYNFQLVRLPHLTKTLI